MKKQQEEFYPAALTIAESDSGGGTGIQADLRTFNAAGIYGASVITAVTAQNPRRMATAEVCSAVLVGKQLECVLDALAIKAVKTGWLGDENIARTVAESLRRCRLPLVVDPVMISTSGQKLLPGKGMDIVRNELLPQAAIITPNPAEAAWLLDCQALAADGLADAARALSDKFHCDVLLKGWGSGKHPRAEDYAVIGGKLYVVSSPAITDLSEFAAHGAGSTFSAAVTAMLAMNSSMKDAVRAAKAHVYGALCETANIGKGLDGMYPPLEDYSSQIAMRPVGAAPGGKRGR